MRIKSKLLRSAAVAIGVIAFEAPYVEPVQAATIYARMAEDIDTICTGPSVIIDTTAGHFAANFARYTLQLNNGSQQCKTQVWSSAVSSFWLHANVWLQNNQSTSNNSDAVIFYDASGIARLKLRGAGGNNQLKLTKVNSVGTTTDLVTCPLSTFPNAGLQPFDMQVNYAVSGGVKIYVNSGSGPVDIGCDYSGDVTTDGNTTLQQVGFLESGIGTSWGWSEVFVSDSDTRSFRLWTCAPASAGTNQNWTPNTVANVNPTTINDSNSVSTTTQPTESLWKGPAPPAGTYAVVDVASSLRLEKSATGPATAKAAIRPESGSTDYFSSTTFSLLTSFANYFFDWGVTDPNTSAPYLMSAFATNCGQAGAESQP